MNDDTRDYALSKNAQRDARNAASRLVDVLRDVLKHEPSILITINNELRQVGVRIVRGTRADRSVISSSRTEKKP